MDTVSILLWVSLIAAVPVAAAGLILRRRALAQGLTFPRDIAGWALIAGAILLALAAGYFFWRMNAAGG
jgi:hypothetical protein